MKKHRLCLVTAFVCALLFTACEKPLNSSGDAPASETANLVLQVKGFNVIPFAVSRAAGQVADYCSRLNFVIYQGGKKVKAVNQDVSDKDFGHVAFTLEPGSYQVLILAHSANGNPSLSSPEKVQFTNANGYTDTFYYYDEVTVADGTNAEEIVLNRVTSMFRFITKDEVPAGVERIRFYYTGGSGALNAVTGFGCVSSQQVVFFDVTDEMRGKPLTLEAYTIPKAHTGALKIQISAYDSNSSVLREKELEDVPIEINKITEYTGYFFTDNGDDTPHNPVEDGQHGYSIRLHTEWDGTLQGTF